MPTPFVLLLPVMWPILPDAVAAEHCDLCSWAWRDGAMRVKAGNRSCPVHGRFLPARHDV